VAYALACLWQLVEREIESSLRGGNALDAIETGLIEAANLLDALISGASHPIHALKRKKGAPQPTTMDQYVRSYAAAAMIAVAQIEGCTFGAAAKRVASVLSKLRRARQTTRVCEEFTHSNIEQWVQRIPSHIKQPDALAEKLLQRCGKSSRAVLLHVLDVVANLRLRPGSKKTQVRFSVG
jgi:hypothetical protein